MTTGSGRSSRSSGVVVDGMPFSAYQVQVRSALMLSADAGMDLSEWLTRLCTVSTQMLAAFGVTVTGVRAATITEDAATITEDADAAAAGLGSDGEASGRLVTTSRYLIAASGFPVRVLDDAQGTFRAGPGIDATVAGSLVLAPHLAVDGWTRWPEFTELALARGVRAAFAFPLQVGSAPVGVLGVYRSQPGALSPRERWIAAAFAIAATDALVDPSAPAQERARGK